MKVLSVVKLNKLLCTNKGDNEQRLIYGNQLFATVDTLKNEYPYSTVCVVCSAEVYDGTGQRFQACLNAMGLNCQKVIMPVKAVYSVEDSYPMANLPDNVRAIITFESELLDIVKYSARAKGAKVFFAPFDGNYEGAFKQKSFIRLVDKCEIVPIDLPLTVIVSDKGLKTDQLLNIYVNVIKRASSFLDITFSALANKKKIDAKAFNLLEMGVKSALNLFTAKKNQHAKILVRALIAVNIAEYLLDKEFSECLAQAEAEDFYKITLNQRPRQKNVMEITSVLVNLYTLGFDGSVALEYTDYFELAKNISQKINLGSQTLLKIIKENNLKLKTLEKSLKLKKNKKLTALQGAVKANLAKMLSTYYALGGEKLYPDDRVTACIKLCGVLGGINGVSYLREKGLIELF